MRVKNWFEKLLVQPFYLHAYTDADRVQMSPIRTSRWFYSELINKKLIF